MSQNEQTISRFSTKLSKKARQETGLDQAEVAKLLGKTQSHISKVEAGQRRIDVVTLKEFAKAYKKPLNFFIK